MSNYEMQVLWELPVAPTAVDNDPRLNIMIGRNINLEFVISHNRDPELEKISLMIKDVVAYKCSFLFALMDYMRPAYGQFCEIKNSDWIFDLKNKSTSISYDIYKHYIITFDDGPCYEFIASSYQIERSDII